MRTTKPAGSKRASAFPPNVPSTPLTSWVPKPCRAGFATAGPPLSRHSIAKCLVIVPLDRFVALARGLLQAVDVEDLDVPPPVADEVGFLQGTRDKRNARALNAEHLA